MSFLRRVKKEANGKTYEYLYWCKRTRSKKKDKGSGKVRNSDISLGTSTRSYVGYYAYVGEFSAQEYVKKYSKLICRELASAEFKLECEVNFPIETLPDAVVTVKLRSFGKWIDLRTREGREFRESINRDINNAWNEALTTQFYVENAARWLWEFNRAEKSIADCRRAICEHNDGVEEKCAVRVREFRQENFHIHLGEVRHETLSTFSTIQLLEDSCEAYWTWFNEAIEGAINSAPSEDKRKEFRQRILEDVHRLKNSSQMINRWEQMVG